MIDACARCGCTETTACVDETGRACSWAAPSLCSACASTDRAATGAGGEAPPVAALIIFEREHPGGSGQKEEAVRLRFGVTLARWSQLLGAAVRTRAAVKFDPIFVRQYRARIDAGRRQRAALLGQARQEQELT